MTDRELQRRAAHRWPATSAKTCRYDGIARQAYYSGCAGTRRAGSRPCGTAARARTPARTPPRPRSWARSSTCARPTTSGRTRSRCTSSGTTSSGSARRDLADRQAPGHEPRCRRPVPLHYPSHKPTEPDGLRRNREGSAAATARSNRHQRPGCVLSRTLQPPTPGIPPRQRYPEECPFSPKEFYSHTF